PTVSIKQPKNNAVVIEGSTIVVDVDAQDDVAVVSAGLLVDDKLIFTDTALPYQMPLDIPIGATSIKIKAQAVDLGNNTGVSEVITLTVQADADKDGLGDGEEKDTYKTKPDVADTDGDGLNDGEEILLGTNPLATDSDGDGISDKTEIDQETDPLNSDVTKPKISRLSPADKAKDIPENTQITLDFDEGLRFKTVNSTNIFLKRTDDNLVIAGRLKQSGQQVIVIFDDLLADFTQYTLVIKGVRDVSGNIIERIETNFTTGNLEDTVAPTVAFVIPYANAQQVPINTMIRVKMSERIKPETVTEAGFYLYDQKLSQKVAGSFSVDESQQILTFIPNLPLAVGRGYRIYISSVKDLFDKSMASKQ
ncbi:MAG: Ig-like domain-containing protein, partial [Methylococcales bacterium]|nr:Ig-like domain-containing protein [Methylococcales bacterium]